MGIEIKLKDQKIEAELAADILSHFVGMRFKSKGKMLFKFYRESRPQIDMIFVPKTLYLYFLDSDKQVVDVQKADPWSWHPGTWQFYRPKKKSKYLLESFRPLDLEEGDELEFSA